CLRTQPCKGMISLTSLAPARSLPLPHTGGSRNGEGVMKRTAVHVWISVLLLLLVSHGYSRAAGIGWAEAVARLARERSKAETCVALLKGHGNAAQISNGQLTYGTAKQENDGVIAGLL